MTIASVGPRSAVSRSTRRVFGGRRGNRAEDRRTTRTRTVPVPGRPVLEPRTGALPLNYEIG